VVQTDSESLTVLDNSFRSKWVNRIHRIGYVEVGVAEVDVGTNLLQSRGCAKDTHDGHLMRQSSDGKGSSGRGGR
jgi:hypothetical protein